MCSLNQIWWTLHFILSKKRAQMALFFVVFCLSSHSAFSYKIPHCCYSEKYWFWTQFLRDHTTANTDIFWVHFYTILSQLKAKNITFAYVGHIWSLKNLILSLNTVKMIIFAMLMFKIPQNMEKMSIILYKKANKMQ